MDNNDLKKALLQAFAEEAPELLEKAQLALLDLEAAPQSEQAGHVNALKRALHSLKGSASAIGRADIRDVTHMMENLLAASAMSPELLDCLYTGLSFLVSAVADPALAQDAGEVLAYLQAGQFVLEQQADAGEGLAEAGFAVQATTGPAVIASATPEAAVAVAPALPAAAAPAETIRVAIDKIENIQSSLGDLVVMRLMQKEGHGKLVEIQSALTAAGNEWRQLKNEIAELRPLLPPAIASRLNTRMSDYSSQVKQIQRSVFQLSRQMAAQVGQLNLLSDEIDNGLRSIRMMPIAPFLESYRAVAREAARQLGKPVQLECEDRGIEIDRLVLEKLREPLMHIVRNCVSHGIEEAGQRLAVGKPEVGTIRLQAELSGDYVLLRIGDDGGGYDARRIAEQALRLGLLKGEEELGSQRLLELVTMPGFSTARQADLVSGRGVGMDVVATLVAELGGVIELENNPGAGSCLSLRVPASLAISQGLILRIGERRFGVVLDNVERIVRTRLASLAEVQGKQVLYVGADPVSVCSLAKLLGLEALAPGHTQQPLPLVILRLGAQRLALVVDEVPGEIPMVIKSMGPQFEQVQAYAGGAILADGTVLPVLDARFLLSRVAENAGLRLEAMVAEGAVEQTLDVRRDGAASPAGRTIIVVDDSITTRTLERNILEAAGYRVAVATDGVEALDLLLMEDSVSLLVTDMEMPRMDGLELCRKVRAGRHADLPIIMVTSLGSAEEMKKGIQAGADAYIVKGDFQQEHFLETVRRFAH